MKALPLSICIIESDTRLAGQLAQVMVDLGYQISCMTDCLKKAWQSMKKQAPAVVIMGRPGEKQDMSYASFLVEVNGKLPTVRFLYLMPWQALLPSDKVLSHAVLLPPYTAERVGLAIEQALLGPTQSKVPKAPDLPSLTWLRDRIFIRHKQMLERVFVKDISYVQADNAYIHIVTRVRTFTVTAHLGRFEQMIRHPLLMRVHRSFIVNLAMVESIEPNFSQINLAQKGVPVSSSYRDALKNRINYL